MKLVEYQPAFYPLIKNYYIEDDTYTGSPLDAVNISTKAPEYHSILCIEDDVLVTFFVLDAGEDKYKYTTFKNSLLLRRFSTDSRHIRKGYAKKSLNQLRNFIHHHYPEYESVVLGVNERNTPAIRLYENSGFEDTGRRFKGAKGYQKILVMKI